jgi:hypothetical protein
VLVLPVGRIVCPVAKAFDLLELQQVAPFAVIGWCRDVFAQDQGVTKATQHAVMTLKGQRGLVNPLLAIYASVRQPRDVRGIGVLRPDVIGIITRNKQSFRRLQPAFLQLAGDLDDLSVVLRVVIIDRECDRGAGKRNTASPALILPLAG